jgi:phage terminase Nu1 subunit (DNA packaging protein)
MSELTWPAEKMAKFIDVSPRHLQRLVADGIIPKHERGRYSPIQVNLAYIRYLRDRAAMPGQSESEYAAAKLAKIRAEKEEIDLTMEIKRGLRIPIEDALEVTNRVFQSIAGTLKANRDKVLTEKHINEMLGALRDATRRIGSSNGRHDLDESL